MKNTKLRNIVVDSIEGYVLKDGHFKEPEIFGPKEIILLYI